MFRITAPRERTFARHHRKSQKCLTRDIGRNDQIRVCSQSLKSAKVVLLGGRLLTADHPHPEHCFIADIDIVLARECQLAVITNTEHRQARGIDFTASPSRTFTGRLCCATSRRPLGSM